MCLWLCIMYVWFLCQQTIYIPILHKNSRTKLKRLHFPKSITRWQFMSFFHFTSTNTHKNHWNLRQDFAQSITFIVDNHCIPTDKRSNLTTVFLFLHENIYCGYSLEAPYQGAFNEYPQHMFLWGNKENINIFVHRKNAFLEISVHSTTINLTTIQRKFSYVSIFF